MAGLGASLPQDLVCPRQAAWERLIGQGDPGGGQPRLRFLPTEAALVTAAVGGWVTAAVTWGPLGWPGHLLTRIYLADAAGGYWWLRRHEAVRAARQRREDAADWAARKAEWHRVAHLIGLGDFHLQKVTPTLLGEELLLTSAPGSDLASRVARNSDAIAEKYAHLEGLPYGRVDISTTEFPGQLVIGIRRVDPSVKGIVYHPLTAPWPSAEPSPYAGWFPAEATIRDPVPVGIIPETGDPMTVTLFDEIGAKAIGVHGATGSGKSTLLNDVRERVTAMRDAALVQLNGAHMGDELTWEPLAAATACGPAASDEEVRDKILANVRSRYRVNSSNPAGLRRCNRASRASLQAPSSPASASPALVPMPVLALVWFDKLS